MTPRVKIVRSAPRTIRLAHAPTASCACVRVFVCVCVCVCVCVLHLSTQVERRGAMNVTCAPTHRSRTHEARCENAHACHARSSFTCPEGLNVSVSRESQGRRQEGIDTVRHPTSPLHRAFPGGGSYSCCSGCGVGAVLSHETISSGTRTGGRPISPCIVYLHVSFLAAAARASVHRTPLLPSSCPSILVVDRWVPQSSHFPSFVSGLFARLAGDWRCCSLQGIFCRTQNRCPILCSPPIFVLWSG